MSHKLVICDGKYTFILPDNDYRIKVLRYDEEWLWIEAGSKAVGSLVIKHIEAQQALAEQAREVAELKGLLRESILDIMERREYSVCWHDGSDFDGDCGNWPECNPECSLRKLMDAVGIKPQVDGGVDKQHE